MVTLSAASSDCTSPQYEFWVLPPQGSWTVVQSYSAATDYRWNTSGLAAGNYDLAVWVRAAGAAATYQTYSMVPSYTLYGGFTMTWYIQSTSLADADAQGSAAAQEATITSPADNHYVILDFGAQYCGGAVFAGQSPPSCTVEHIEDSYNDQYGVIGGIREVSQAFIKAYVAAAPSASTTFIIGTNNSLLGSYSDASQTGVEWADDIASIRAYVATTVGTVGIMVVGGNDIQELAGTGGPEIDTGNWDANYLAEAGQGYYNFGSCDNCPNLNGVSCPYTSQGCTLSDPALPGADSTDGTWTVGAVGMYAGANGHTAMIPEIYGGNIAEQWTYLLLYEDAAPGAGFSAPLVGLAGVLTQCTAAVQMNYGATFTPSQAWYQLATLLFSEPWSPYLTGVVAPAASTDTGYQASPPYPTPSSCLP